MIKNVIRAIYAAVISIVFISIVLSAWTGYAFIFQPTKSSQIFYFIQDIYESQKDVIIDVVDLSKLLLKDTSERKANEKNNFLPEAESLKDQMGMSQSDESLMLEENANPLGIVIEPSSSDAREKRLPEISEEPLVDENPELSINQMKMN
tara:strand:- start:91 stop:540 length:450 start_codon:yes stop_codon:yes gene_type:complete